MRGTEIGSQDRGRSGAAATEDALSARATRVTSPLTERILARLGKPRWFWIALWGASALVQPFVVSVGVSLSGNPGGVDLADNLVAQAVVAYVVVLVLWGIGRLTRDSAALQPQLDRLTGEAGTGGVVRGVGRVAGPALLTTGIVLVSMVDAWIHLGPLTAVLRLPLLIITTLPMMVFVWTYLELLIGLDELGRTRLALEEFPPDRSLGLGEVGSLAFGGFVLLFAAAAPLMLFDFATLLLALAVVIVSVPTFFLSMWRLHCQMAAGKQKYVDQAQAAYREAYEPYRTDATLKTLEARAPLLSAAQALEDRAQGIRVWPIDEWLIKVMGFIVTVAATTIVGRIILLAIAR
jgi:hypothetical protein